MLFIEYYGNFNCRDRHKTAWGVGVGGKEGHLTQLERERELERLHQEDIPEDLIRAETNT